MFIHRQSPELRGQFSEGGPLMVTSSSTNKSDQRLGIKVGVNE